MHELRGPAQPRLIGVVPVAGVGCDRAGVGRLRSVGAVWWGGRFAGAKPPAAPHRTNRCS